MTVFFFFLKCLFYKIELFDRHTSHYSSKDLAEISCLFFIFYIAEMFTFHTRNVKKWLFLLYTCNLTVEGKTIDCNAHCRTFSLQFLSFFFQTPFMLSYVLFQYAGVLAHALKAIFHLIRDVVQVSEYIVQKLCRININFIKFHQKTPFFIFLLAKIFYAILYFTPFLPTQNCSVSNPPPPPFLSRVFKHCNKTARNAILLHWTISQSKWYSLKCLQLPRIELN